MPSASRRNKQTLSQVLDEPFETSFREFGSRSVLQQGIQGIPSLSVTFLLGTVRSTWISPPAVRAVRTMMRSIVQSILQSIVQSIVQSTVRVVMQSVARCLRGRRDGCCTLPSWEKGWVLGHIPGDATRGGMLPREGVPCEPCDSSIKALDSNKQCGQ